MQHAQLFDFAEFSFGPIARPSELRKECIKHNILASGDLEAACGRNHGQPVPQHPPATSHFKAHNSPIWHRFILTCAGARYWAHPRSDSSHLSVRVRLVHSVMVGDRSCLVLVTAGCAPLQSSNACSDVLFTRRADGLRCLHVKALICVQVFRSICILTCRLLRNGFRLTHMCALAARISSPC